MAPAGRTKQPMAVKALIVDDSPLARKVIAFHLKQIRCTVAGEAASAAEALNLLRELHPDVVTLDLMMPKENNLDAMDLLGIIKKEMPAVLVVVITSIPFEKTRRDLLDRGVFEYVVKPVNQFSFKKVQLKLIRAFPELASAN